MKRAKRIDPWIMVSVLILALYLLFLVYPMLNVLGRSVVEDGKITFKYFVTFFSQDYYISTLWNSFKVSIATTAVSLILGIPLAYFYNIYEIHGRKLLQTVIVLCTMSAPFIGAYAWILLLGNNGVITAFLKTVFNIKIPSIYGFSGILLAMSTRLFPLAFMYVSSAMQNIDNTLLEASANLGCTGFKRFWKIGISLCMPSILAAALNHWHECSVCNKKQDEAAHIPDYDEPTEDTAVKCTVCDRTLKEELHHQHTLYLTLVPAVKATCKAEGNIAYYRCTCNRLFADEKASSELTEAETVTAKDPDNHDGGTEVRNAKEPSYTEEGYTGDTYCLGCDAKLAEGKVIPKLKKPSSGGSVKLPVSPNAGVGKKPEDEKKGLPFTDVPQTTWYYESVQSAWAAGLIDGVTATKFKPDDTLTVAQAIKLAAALYQMEHEGEVTLKNGGVNWYDSYVSYAVANGIIEKDYASYTAAQMNAAITRAEFVHIFHGAESTYKAINQVADDAIPDVKTGDAFASNIYEFYRAGILTGSDAKGTFHPADSIKRSEASAIPVRMFDTASRQSITL